MRTALITIFSVLFLDQAIKLWIKCSFRLNEVIADWGFVHFEFVENRGMAFGVQFGGDWGKLALSLFRVVAVIAIAMVIKNLHNNKAKTGLLISVGMIFAGALGNILDSAFYGLMFSESTSHQVAQFMPEAGGYAGFMMGSVVDMIRLEYFPAVFNVADSAISIGVAIMIIWNKTFFGAGKGDFSIFRKNYQPPQEEVAESEPAISETTTS